MAKHSSVVKEKSSSKSSHLVTALSALDKKIDTEVKGEYGHTVIIKTGNVKIKNSQLDCDFEIPFDDDTEANEAEIVIYNLSKSTVKNIKVGEKITVEAGYGSDTGIIFSGYIAKRKTAYEDVDKVTTITAIDSQNLKERDIKSISFAKNTKASYILKTLCKKLNLPIAVFKVARDHTFKDEESVSGGLMDNIRKYAKICGVSAYIHKGKVYVRKLSEGDNTSFKLSSRTGLLSIDEFERTEENADYKDKIKGYKVKMLLQHRLQTASIITIDSKTAKGKFRVKSGTHYYDGKEFITEAEVV